MPINRVTITGADDSVSPKDLIKLSEEFNFVEWGILFSSSKENAPRFPSKNWINELTTLNLNLAAHICGDLVKDLSTKDKNIFLDRPEFIQYFPRIQLNFSPYQIKESLLETLKQYNNQFIFQIGKQDEKINILNDGLNQGLNLAVLYDQSGGKGILPEEGWNEPICINQGYAGGLGPDNLAEQLPKILEKAGKQTIWIDMESKVRSKDDFLFDLDKVKCCLEICRPFCQ